MPWMGDQNAALLTDLYELTMAEAYLAEGLSEPAVFSLFYRRLPARRNFLLACGLERRPRFLQALRFTRARARYLASPGAVLRPAPGLAARLPLHGRRLRGARGHARVRPASRCSRWWRRCPQAQLVETFLLNQVHLQTVRGVEGGAGGAGGRAGARWWTSGCAARTARTPASRWRGRPTSPGVDAPPTCWPGEPTASRSPAPWRTATSRRTTTSWRPSARSPRCTRDDPAGRHLRHARGRARRRAAGAGAGPGFQRARGAAGLGRPAGAGAGAQEILDEAGLRARADLRQRRARRGRGRAAGRGRRADRRLRGGHARWACRRTRPALDMAYKLVAYAGRGRIKLSPGKALLPGRKQVFRGGARTALAHARRAGALDEALPGRPLLAPVMRMGRRLMPGPGDLHALRRGRGRRSSTCPKRSAASLRPPRPTRSRPARGSSPSATSSRGSWGDVPLLEAPPPVGDSPGPGTRTPTAAEGASTCRSSRSTAPAWRWPRCCSCSSRCWSSPACSAAGSSCGASCRRVSLVVFFFVVYSCLGVFGMIRNGLYGLTLLGLGLHRVVLLDGAAGGGDLADAGDRARCSAAGSAPPARSRTWPRGFAQAPRRRGAPRPPAGSSPCWARSSPLFLGLRHLAQPREADVHRGLEPALGGGAAPALLPRARRHRRRPAHAARCAL